MASVAEFRQGLQKNAVSFGAEWVKADFHVHCPRSSDYEYKAADAMQRLGESLRDQGYRYAVILKHQEFPTRSELDELRSHCQQTTLIPGAEVNVFVEAMFKKVSKDHYFHCIVAVDPDIGGDYSYLLQRARDGFSYKAGEYPAGFRSSILDLGRFFREHGALFLPAHLHQAKDPHESKSIDDIYDDDAFLGFVEDGAFSALEVRQKSTADFFTGTRHTENGRRIPRAVCVQSSDAHSHTHILERGRNSWIQIERPTFGELVASLAFPHRICLDMPSLPQQRIIGVHIVGVFLADLWVGFNPGMNSLIGCKGSGKTSVLECLRFLFSTSVPKERRESVTRHVAHILGSSGIVECLVKRADGKSFVLTRRADSPQRLTVTDEGGGSQDVDHIEEYFDVSILGWHEIEAVADDASVRISLLDGIKGGQAIRDRYSAIDAHILQARDHLPLLQQRLRRLNEALRDLWELRRKRETLKRLEKAELVELQNQYEWYLAAEQKLRSHGTRLQRHRESLHELLPFDSGVSLADDLGGTIPHEVRADIDAAADALDQLISRDTESGKSLLETGQTVAAAIDKAVTAVGQHFTVFRDSVYNPRVQQLPPEERDILTRQIQILEETRALPQKEEDCRNLHSEVLKLASSIETLCDAVCKARDEICQIRETAIASLNEDLDSVKLRFLRGGNKSRLTRYREKYVQESGSFVSFLQGYGHPEAYENFREIFRGLRTTDVQADAWKVNELMWDVKLVDFLSVVDDDDVEITLQVGTAGFVPIQNLSAGQRCTAIFPLLLRNARGPLVIDQPEDNLDNRHIADTIAPDLLVRKAEQQYVTTSHNANLVVLTDADLILHMDSDGQRGWIASAGFLACPESQIRRSVIDVLDGGEAALEARRRKYGTVGIT